jgi:hypothetical protein
MSNIKPYTSEKNYIDNTDYQTFIDKDVKMQTKQLVLSYLEPIIILFLLLYTIYLVGKNKDIKPVVIYIALLCVYYLMLKKL